MKRMFLSVVLLSFLYASLMGCQTVEEVQAEENCLLDSCAQQQIVPQVQAQSVFEQDLQSCSENPLTGFFRDSYCRTDKQDRGVHVVCAVMTPEFLQYTKSQGNDLSTPAPQYGFEGLKDGDRWCLCAARWYEAYLEGKAPPVVLSGTDKKALEIVPLSALTEKSLSE